MKELKLLDLIKVQKVIAYNPRYPQYPFTEKAFVMFNDTDYSFEVYDGGVMVRRLMYAKAIVECFYEKQELIALTDDEATHMLAIMDRIINEKV